MLKLSAVLRKSQRNFFLNFEQSFSGFTVESVDYDFVQEIDRDVRKTLIDVRGRDETQESGVIPGSINIPQDCLARFLGSTTSNTQFYEQYGREKPSANSQLVFYCRSGKRARESAQQALALGYKNVKIYEGSWIDWQQHEDNFKEKY